MIEEEESVSIVFPLTTMVNFERAELMVGGSGRGKRFLIAIE
jgi:hypothetical protein